MRTLKDNLKDQVLKFFIIIVFLMGFILMLILYSNGRSLNVQKCLNVSDKINVYLPSLSREALIGNISQAKQIFQIAKDRFLTDDIKLNLEIYKSPQKLESNSEICEYSFLNTYLKVPVDVAGQKMGEIQAVFPNLNYLKSFILFSGLIIIFYIVGYLFYQLLLRRLDSIIIKPLHQLLSETNSSYPSPEIAEVKTLSNKLSRMHSVMLENERQQSQINQLKAVSSLSEQVAHDIRSPLSVLSSISQGIKANNEHERTMLRMAIQSINDIANDLSAKSKMDRQNFVEKKEVILISALIDSLVSEKRIEHRSKMNLNLTAALNLGTYGLFVNVNPTTFKRVFSNLINNSIESFTAGGDVQLQLQSNEGFVQILVKDNGKGIPTDKLDSIFERGKSFGKERKENSGLGLYHAKESIESWGGTITVESEVGVGTEFTITLPLAKQPDWFLGRIILKQDKQFVIIDDDQSIHEIWKNRLGEAGASVQQMQHFSSADSFEKWIHATDKSDRYLFLFDYELLGSKKTGLDLIEEFQLQDQAVLVTSRYEEPSIRERCQKIGLKLLPKSLAGYVPIVKEASYVVPKQRVDCVFVDDNDLVRMNWERKAAEVGINILTFGNTTDFYAKLHLCDQDTVFFIDQHLNDGTYGLDTAKNLKQKGFHKIYMASGFDADELGVPKGIVKGCVGKKPPFDDLTVFNRAKQSEDDDER